MQAMTVPAVIESIPRVTAWIDETLEQLDCSLKAQMQIDVAIDEVFSNIARYAYPDGKGIATVETDFEESSRVFTITFQDQGVPFDPLTQSDPDTSLATEDREIGGLGIFVVKKTMDEVSYEYREGSNFLCLKKHI